MNNRRGTTVVSNDNRRLQRRPVIHVLPDEMALRVVCHASVIGGIIGSNGSIISNLRRETGTKIHCESPVNGSEHWVVFIVGSTAVNRTLLLTNKVGDVSGEERGDWVAYEVSAAQTALIRVLERSWAILAAKDSGGEKEAYCGILAARNQIGAVLGIGGRNVEWMRRNSGAMIRVLPPPTCGSNSDELLQITGDVLGVKKALVMVSSYLQNCPPLNGYPLPLCTKPLEPSSSSSTHGNSDDPHSEFFPNLRSLLPASTRHSYEEGDSFQVPKDREGKVVFKLICSSAAAGGIIGKKGTIIRALQNETGASISIGTPFKVSGERLVTISARESLEAHYSHAQKALVRVFARSVDIDVERGLVSPSALVIAKMLVPSHIAKDLARNRADVHIPVGDQILECFSENEMVIEIKGEYRHVEKALSQVSSKLRDSLLPKEVSEEMRAKTCNPFGSSTTDYNPQPSHQNASRDNPIERDLKQLQLSMTEDLSSFPPRSKGVTLRKVSLELALEKDALDALYGRDGAGLDHLQQISGAKVDPTGVERMVLVSGTPEQTRTAMSLIFSILDDQ